jgi:uncharacterized membrane protein YfcA
VQWLGIVLIGAAIGFLGGLFGKGGSSVATPLLAAIGLPPIVAVASPLPATVPGTLVAYRRYRDEGIRDSKVVRWSIAFGAPATVVGAILTRWISGGFLVKLTDVIVALIGIRVLLRRDSPETVRFELSHRPLRLVAVAATVGFVAGLLANAGGFLLVPLYLTVLKLPIKTALSCSLLVASVLAVPGAVVHAALGHIDWTVTAVFAAASIPLSSLGAKIALRMNSLRLERVYGGGLALLGTALFFVK